jgi:membrane fusion protein (multidrug efflux system)
MTIALEYADGWRERASALRRNGRKYLVRAGALAALVAGLAYGEHWLSVGRFIETTDDAYVGGDITAIAPHVAGFVSEIEVSDNEQVRRGQLLMRIDNRDFRAALDHAAAAVANRRAVIADFEARSEAQRAAIAQAAADLSAKLAQAKFAHDDNLRYQGLARALAISRQDVQKASAANEIAQSSVAAGQANVTAADQQLRVLAANIEQAKADLAQAEADLRAAQLDLSYTEIRSPIDGFIGNRAVRAGAYVPVGAYLISIIPSHGLWVDANFKEDQLAHLKPGQSATIVADVLPGRTFHGHVQSLAPGTGAVFSVIPPENATGNFTKIVQRVPVRIALDASDARLGGLRPGLSITASIDTRADKP